MSKGAAAPPRLALITATDVPYLEWLAARLARPDMRSFWEDRMRVDPLATFGTLFVNPETAIAFDVGPGDGVLAFWRVSPGYRAYLFGASWGRNAMRNPELRRQAAKAAMLALEFEVLDGITAEDNARARKAMEGAGMRYRGRIPKGLCYSGVEKPGVWYELTRADLDLPAL